MNYEDMSDFEVNKEVGKLVSTDGRIYIEDDFVYLNPYDDKSFNPCNNPSDAWPIIVENKISISFMDEGEIYASQGELDEFPWAKYEHASTHNPLRAAMICFLKMKESES